jgi:parallel beta-helix repeat protein
VKLRAFYNSSVERNTVEGVKFGIAVVDSQNTVVRANSVQASDIAYHFSESRGGNTVQQNRIIGNPLRGWELSQVHPSDQVQQR